MTGLIVDLFAGGGGSSTGIFMALGQHPDYAIDLDREALSLHALNHPSTQHLCEDVRSVDPVTLVRRADHPVDLLWMSPSCTAFSKARLHRGLNAQLQALAWVGGLWAQSVRPKVIILENVEEFLDWVDFESWCQYLQRFGYQVEHRILNSADFGVPTMRKRLFVVARRDGLPIVWPQATHTKEQWVPVSKVIDFDLPCPSLFDTKMVSEQVQARLRAGAESGEPFTLIQRGYGERPGQKPRVPGLHKPLGTIVASGIKHYLVHYRQGTHAEATRKLLGDGRFSDIGIRPLTVQELYLAQGFPPDYKLEGTKTLQVRVVGNSVCPPLAAAVVAANCAQPAPTFQVGMPIGSSFVTAPAADIYQRPSWDGLSTLSASRASKTSKDHA